MLRQESIDEFHQASGANRPIVVLEQLHWRIQEVRRLDPHEIPVFLLEKLDSGMRQRLQRCAEPVLHSARAIRDASHLPAIAAEKCNDPIGLSERVSLQYNRVALMKRHASFATLQISTPEEFMPDNILQTDVVGLGANAVDTVCVMPRFPEPNSKIPLSDVRIQFGGQVATALITCTRLGLRARYVGSVGADQWGEAQVASLQSEMNLEVHVREVEGATSQFSVILLEEGVGERTILARRDPKLNYPPALLRREMIVGGRVLLLDSYDSEGGIQAAMWAREAGMPIVIDIDAVQDELTPKLLRLVDYLIASSDFAEDPRELAEKYGCPVVGVTRGAAGAVFLDRGRLLVSPAFKVPVVDTTGAGDVFHGAFIYGVLQKWPLEEIIRFSHAAAALNCMHIGARGGIPALSQVQEFLKNR